MKKMVLMSVLCISLSIDAMKSYKSTSNQSNQNLQEIKKDSRNESKNLQIDELEEEEEKEEESDVDDSSSEDDKIGVDGTVSEDIADLFDDDALSTSGTPSLDYDLRDKKLEDQIRKNQKNDSEESIEIPFEGEMSREPSQEPIDHPKSVRKAVHIMPPEEDSDNSFNIGIGSKISRSSSNPPPSMSIDDSDAQEISRSDSNPYIPPCRKSISDSSDYSDYSPSNPKKKPWFHYHPAAERGIDILKTMGSKHNQQPSGDSSSSSSAIGSPGGFKNHQRYYDTNHKNIDSQKNSFNNAPVIKIGSNFGNSSNSSSNSSATGSPRGFKSQRWHYGANHKSGNHSGNGSKQDLTKKYGSVPSSPKSPQPKFNGFSPERISSSSSNGSPTPPPPTVQANQNVANPKVEKRNQNDKSKVVIEKKKKESSSSSSDDEK